MHTNNNDALWFFVSSILIINLPCLIAEKTKTESKPPKKDLKCHRPLDVVLALDSSGRTSKANWLTIVEFCKSLTMELEPISSRQNRISIMTFNERPQVITELKTGVNRSEIVKSLNHLRRKKTSGMTFTDDALKEAMRVYEKGKDVRDAYKVMVLFYDGKTTDRLGKRGISLMKSPVEQLHKDDVQTFVVEFGRFIEEDDILGFVSEPKLDHIYTLNDLPELSTAIKKAAWRVCAEVYS
eukprot:gene10757-11907_t